MSLRTRCRNTPASSTRSSCSVTTPKRRTREARSSQLRVVNRAAAGIVSFIFWGMCFVFRHRVLRHTVQMQIKPSLTVRAIARSRACARNDEKAAKTAHVALCVRNVCQVSLVCHLLEGSKFIRPYMYCIVFPGYCVISTESSHCFESELGGSACNCSNTYVPNICAHFHGVRASRCVLSGGYIFSLQH